MDWREVRHLHSHRVSAAPSAASAEPAPDFSAGGEPCLIAVPLQVTTRTVGGGDHL
jgi:hypothetical protein